MATSIRSWNAAYRSLLLVGMILFLVRLMLDGQIALYIHPRFIWLTWVTCGGLVLMLVEQLAQIRVHSAARVPEGYYLASAALLAVGFAIRPHLFGADLASKQGLNLTVRSSGSPSGQAVPPPTDQMLEIDSFNFTQFLDKMYANPQAFVGKRVAIEGFAFNPPTAKNGEFAIVRLVVTCHVAHAAPDGLVVTVPGQVAPKQDTWHRAEGTLEAFELNGVKTVRLVADKFTDIDEPPIPYVFPSVLPPSL